MENEHQLIQQVSQGNRKAMEILYQQYAGMATAVVMRYLPNRDEARDVLQDSFLKVFTRSGQFQYKGEGSLKAWVMRICANEALDFLRRQHRLGFTGLMVDLPDEGDPEVDRVPPDVLTRMIGKLPPGYRAVLNLFVFEQKSHKEIAELLGIKEDSSASQFSRAKHQLAVMIKDYLKKQG